MATIIPDTPHELKDNTCNDRHPNFRDSNGNLFLVRCFKCEPENGVENWAMAVASGKCAWCGRGE